ncbi:MAG: FG-GAP-like repeat-containing protein [Acidobacteriota bacterium]
MRSLLIAVLALIVAACGPSGPPTDSTEAVRAFYVGLAALQVGDDIRAGKELTRATELAALEPAAWLNLGILQMRQRDYDGASRSLEHARTLDDKNPKIYETIALLDKQRGNFEASQTNLQKAIALDANNVKAIYALAKEKERQSDDAGARNLYEQILGSRPENLEVQIEAVRLAAKQNDAEAVRRLSALIKPPPPDREPEIGRQFEALHTAVATGDMRGVLTQASYYRNTLLRDARFRADIDAVKYSDTTLGEPFTKPITLQVPNASPASADLSIKLEPQLSNNAARWSKFVYLDGDDKPVVATGDDTVTLVGERSIPFAIESADGIVQIDFDYDFKNDIALAGPKGFRLFKQTDSGFRDVTAATKLGSDILNASRSGVWVLDIESDGDLDLILGNKSGRPAVLQNNSDGSFSSSRAFDEIDGLVEFATADLDEDGDADAIALDTEGHLHYFKNERVGRYKRSDFAGVSTRVSAFDVGDADGDGKLDIIALYDNGAVWMISYTLAAGWELSNLFQVDGMSGSKAVMLADLDNNGAEDITIRGEQRSQSWLGDPERKYVQLDPVAATLSSIADINDDGRLDFAGTSGGRSAIFTNRGARSYNWQTVRPRAAKTTGDQRVNSFGIGGELELRSGLLLQKRLINEPVVHFGLGENPNADVLRIVWQNGYVQAEFDLKPNQTIAAEQRLKGSCPHLFAYNGEKFALVKDAPPWSPALGLKINAQETYGVLATEEWFKIPGAALKPTNDNFYELRITAEYWESYYIDHYSLLAVDHPEGTEVFADERFAIPIPPLEVFTTGPTHEFAVARNDRGEDVSAVVRDLDEKYLDGFERGSFQGVAKDHFVELDLPNNAPLDKKIAIVADGWVHPTDASINVQLGQSAKEKPRSLSLEVRDENGEWKTAKENLGFPAGKMKTILIELPIRARTVRLRTNMEVFWDKLAWGIYEKGEGNRTTRLEPIGSELRYRGFSVIEKADDSSPEKPVYDRMLTTAQRWRDMEGYFTRFGDVRELLLETDNRFVLMNAGDELVLRFPALPAPPVGYRRDFVLIGNGWIKDGDLNSVFSKTLLPLPTHASNDYSKPPTTLENDPVYRQHKADWLNFHTRYVSPDSFRNALR